MASLGVAIVAMILVLVACGTAKVDRFSDLNTQNEQEADISTSTNTAQPLALWWQPEADSNVHWHYQIGRAINGAIYDNSWNNQLETPNDLALLNEPEGQHIKVVAIDTFDNSKKAIQAVQYAFPTIEAVPDNFVPNAADQERRVICYINVGAREEWRVDAPLFPLGLALSELQNWPGEIRVDVRPTNANHDDLRHIMIARMLLAKAKGCDGIEPDNIDGWWEEENTLTRDVMKTYVIWLAETAHNGLDVTEAEAFWNWLSFRSDPNQINQQIQALQQEIQSLETSLPSLGGKQRREARAEIESLNSQIKNVQDLLDLRLQDYLNNIKNFVVDTRQPSGEIPIEISIGLKNGIGGLVTKEVEAYFDWAMNESCAQYLSNSTTKECNFYQDTFVAANKAVFWVEYAGSKDDYCELPEVKGMSLMLAREIVVGGVTKADDAVVADINRVERCDIDPPTEEPPVEEPPTEEPPVEEPPTEEPPTEEPPTEEPPTEEPPTEEPPTEEPPTEEPPTEEPPVEEPPTEEPPVEEPPIEEPPVEEPPVEEPPTEEPPVEEPPVEEPPVEEPPVVESPLITMEFDNLDGWEKCWNGAQLPTVTNSVAHFAGRKNNQGGTDCIKYRKNIADNEVASSYTLTCAAKRDLAGRVELEIYFQGNRSAGVYREIAPTTESNFKEYSLELANPDNSNQDIWIRIKAQRRNGQNADLFVDSCRLEATNSN